MPNPTQKSNIVVKTQADPRDDANEKAQPSAVPATAGNGGRTNPAKSDISSLPAPARAALRRQNKSSTGVSGKETEASSAVNQEVTTSQPLKVERRAGVDALRIPTNPLLPFVNLQYHVVLSMVAQPEVAKIQKLIPEGSNPGGSGSFNELLRSIEAEGSIPFASTGDAIQTDFATFQGNILGEQGQNIVYVGGRNYYNLESLTISNTMAPTAQNPYVTTMFGGKMVLAEPHGFRWAEDARRLANKIGYSGLSMGRVLWRLDIFFSGYNQDTGEWIPFIQLDARTRKTKELTYYINITTVEAKLTHTGTTYDMSIVPSGHVAYRPEEVVLDAGAVYTGTQSQTQTFGGFLDRLAESMEVAVANRTNNQVQRKYEFKAPPSLRSAQFYSGKFERKQGFLKNDPKGGSVLTTARDVNVISLVEDAISDMQVVWDNYLKVDDPKHLEPKVHWGIRFNVVFDSGVNSGNNDYEIITNQYIIEPYVTYKHARMNNRAAMAEVVDINSQAARVKKMVEFGMINRIYDYVNTSENNEVIDLDIKLKNFYYHTMYQPTESSASSGVSQVEASSSKDKKRKEDHRDVDKEGISQVDDFSSLPRRQENTVNSAMKRIFGRNIDNPSGVCDTETFRTPFDIYGGGFGEMPKTDFRSAASGSDQLKRDEYQANVDDHLRNDLIRIEMQVRGDPLWLLTPYGKDSGNILTTGDTANPVGGTTALIQTQSSRCFFLRMFAPTQVDYMNPERAAGSTACSVVGGFYEVVKVQSTFAGGKFVQDLTATKMNHLNYIENFIGLVSNEKVDSATPVDTEVPQRRSQPTTPEPVPSIEDVTGVTNFVGGA